MASESGAHVTWERRDAAMVAAGIVVRMVVTGDDSQDGAVEPELRIGLDTSEIDPALLAKLDGTLRVTLTHDHSRVATQGAAVPSGGMLAVCLRTRHVQVTEVGPAAAGQPGSKD